ncbi:hypothetical protein D3C75_982460 [compost metagenome]
MSTTPIRSPRSAWRSWCLPSPLASCSQTSGVPKTSGISPRKCSSRSADVVRAHSGIRTPLICPGPACIGAMHGSASNPFPSRMLWRSSGARTAERVLMAPPSSTRTTQPNPCMEAACCLAFPISRLSASRRPMHTKFCRGQRSPEMWLCSIPARYTAARRSTKPSRIATPLFSASLVTMQPSTPCRSTAMRVIRRKAFSSPKN